MVRMLLYGSAIEGFPFKPYHTLNTVITHQCVKFLGRCCDPSFNSTVWSRSFFWIAYEYELRYVGTHRTLGLVATISANPRYVDIDSGLYMSTSMSNPYLTSSRI